MSEIYIQIRYVLPLWIITLFTSWFPDNRVTLRIRGKLAGFFMKKCGKNFQLGRDVTLLNTFNLEIGDNVYLAKGGWYNALGGLIISDEVTISPYVVISTLQHVFRDRSVYKGGSFSGIVTIGKGSWIASHSSVKCGVSIGQGCIVASNASVVNDIEDYSICGGVPAKFIKKNVDQEADIFSKSDVLKNINK